MREFEEALKRARAGVSGDAEASEALLAERLAVIERDAIGFAGAKMARRILGLAHVEDLETIPEAERVPCEKRALAMARRLIVDRRNLGITDLRGLAHEAEKTV